MLKKIPYVAVLKYDIGSSENKEKNIRKYNILETKLRKAGKKVTPILRSLLGLHAKVTPEERQNIKDGDESAILFAEAYYIPNMENVEIQEMIRLRQFATLNKIPVITY